jgi:hypothetical protein
MDQTQNNPNGLNAHWQNIFEVLGITYTNTDNNPEYTYQGGEIDAELCADHEAPAIVNGYGETLPLSVRSAIAAHRDARLDTP